MKMKLMALSLALMGIIASCTKDKENDTPTGNGVVKLEFFNNVGSSILNLDNQWYLNEHGDSFKVSKLNYYISNIKLNATYNPYTETESYHLVQQSDASSRAFDLATVPAGTYTGLTFTIGVDSLRNVSGAQTGALDPTNGMFWSWNTGYIMFKMEGTSPQSGQLDKGLVFHFGGFSGANSVLRTVTLNFATPIKVTTSGENHVHITGDLLALFKSPNIINFANTSSVQMPGAEAKGMADNYANMFTVTYAGL